MEKLKDVVFPIGIKLYMIHNKTNVLTSEPEEERDKTARSG